VDEKQIAGVWLLMVDADRFKEVNDNFDWLVGNKVLQHIAKVVEEAAERPIFAGRADHTKGTGARGKKTNTYRVGGEEIMVILEGASSEEATEIAERIRRAVEKPISKIITEKAVQEAHDINPLAIDRLITVSIGVAPYVPGETLSSLLKRANAAEKTAKHDGRNQVVVAPAQSSSRLGKIVEGAVSLILMAASFFGGARAARAENKPTTAPPKNPSASLKSSIERPPLPSGVRIVQRQAREQRENLVLWQKALQNPLHPNPASWAQAEKDADMVDSKMDPGWAQAKVYFSKLRDLLAKGEIMGSQLVEYTQLLEDLNDKVLIPRGWLMLPSQDPTRFDLAQIHDQRLARLGVERPSGEPTSYTAVVYRGYLINLESGKTRPSGKIGTAFGSLTRPMVFLDLLTLASQIQDYHDLVDSKRPRTPEEMKSIEALRRDGFLQGNQLEKEFDQAYEKMVAGHELTHMLISRGSGYARSADEAFAYLSELRSQLRYTGLVEMITHSGKSYALLQVLVELSEAAGYTDLNPVLKNRDHDLNAYAGAVWTLHDRLWRLKNAQFDAIVKKAQLHLVREINAEASAANEAPYTAMEPIKSPLPEETRSGSLLHNLGAAVMPFAHLPDAFRTGVHHTGHTFLLQGSVQPITHLAIYFATVLLMYYVHALLMYFQSRQDRETRMEMVKVVVSRGAASKEKDGSDVYDDSNLKQAAGPWWNVRDFLARALHIRESLTRNPDQTVFRLAA
jgi:GGDEF domain-containing protein